MHGGRLAIEAHEVVVAVASVGQVHQVCGIGPGRARLSLNAAIGELGSGALLAFGTEEQAIGTTLLHSHSVDALHELRAGRGVGETRGSRMGAGIDIGQDPVGGGEAYQGGRKGNGQEELHSG